MRYFEHTGIAIALALCASGVYAQSAPGGFQRLSVDEFVSRLLETDESLTSQVIEQQIATVTLEGEEALYEPEYFITWQRARSYTATTAEDSWRSGTDPTNPYREDDTTFRTGVSFKAPTGASGDVFYDLSRLQNSLQTQSSTGFSPEYNSALGFTVSQPLLRNFGRDATEVDLRLADLEAQIARESGRLALMRRSGEGVRAYIQVQRAQERVSARSKSVQIAENIVREIGRQVRIGLKGADAITEASSALGVRKAELAQAQRELEEQIGTFQTYFGAATAIIDGPRFLPGDPLVRVSSEYTEGVVNDDTATALENRPEVRVNQQLIGVEEVKTDFAENQALPELNLRLEYSRDMLTENKQALLRYLDDSLPFYRSAVILEYRMGIDGGKKKQSEIRVSQLREQQARLTLNAAKQRVISEMEGVKVLVRRALTQVQRQQEVFTAQERLLDVEKARVANGQSSRLEVLNRELDLILAQEGVADAVAQLNITSFLASQANGTILQRFGLE